MKYIWTILLACTILSCHSRKEKNAKQQPVKVEEHKVQSNKKTGSRPRQHAVMEFIEYNDDGDYFLLIAKKGDKVFSFVNDNNDRTLLRGDLIDITWKKAAIEIAGDGDRQEHAEKIISMVKVKDGNVSKFRMEYKKPITYTWIGEESYSKYYLDKLYTLVEYYIANSDNKLLKLSIKNRDQLTYSIESQTREDKRYIIIGISVISENHVNTIQWLYVEKVENMLYEYDLPNDRMVRFD